MPWYCKRCEDEGYKQEIVFKTWLDSDGEIIRYEGEHYCDCCGGEWDGFSTKITEIATWED